MKQLKFFLFLSILAGSFTVQVNAQVQNDEVLLTIAKKNVTVGEFMSIYQKNNTKNEPVDQASLKEYLDLFINFKLKVREAEDLGLDTAASFKTELAGYRDQLAKPYFIDDATMEKLMSEAYDRSQYDLRASHIFIRLKSDALPEDTLEAYNRIVKIKERLTNGESFETLVAEVSEDPSAKDREANAQHPFIKGNRGDLGFFTAFDMVYAFETGAYNTPVGQVSQPVHTEYGYHLIKVTAKQPAMGKVIVAHLFLAIPKGANHQDSLRVAAKADSIYGLLKAGGNWDELVKQYSDDKGSAGKGGVLPKFGVNRMVPEFIAAIYKLQAPGDYTPPILTTYGWHIVKLVERETSKPYEEEKVELKQKVTKDGRSELSRKAVLDKIKAEYGFTEYPEAKTEMYSVVTDSVFVGKWDPAVANNMTKVLFKIGNMNFRQKDLATYIASKQRKRDKENIKAFVNQQYEEYVDETLTKWENAHLEQKYPEFKALINEYRDGILLFDLTDQKVWSKAVKDTTGLKLFYEKNKNNYMWDARVNASVYTVNDQATANRVKNFIKTGLTDEAILKEINIDTAKLVTIDHGKFTRKENPYIEKSNFVTGFSPDYKEGNKIIFVYVREVLKPEPKQLNEARGLITADYQNYLEKEWIKELKQKYPVVVNQAVFVKIK
jgi:peptidyl-prolyl cis-trans isomerase SurA